MAVLVAGKRTPPTVFRRRRPSVGEAGWLGLVAYIVAVDSIAWRKNSETMSVAFGKSLQHPAHRTATVLAWTVVTGHLFWSTPLWGSQTLKKVVLGYGKRASCT